MKHFLLSLLSLAAFGCSDPEPIVTDGGVPDAPMASVGPTHVDVVSAAGHLTGGAIEMDLVISQETP